jgi:hypothetical protein
MLSDGLEQTTLSKRPTAWIRPNGPGLDEAIEFYLQAKSALSLHRPFAMGLIHHGEIPLLGRAGRLHGGPSGPVEPDDALHPDCGDRLLRVFLGDVFAASGSRR